MARNTKKVNKYMNDQYNLTYCLVKLSYILIV